jgi:hypothetical protein
VLACARQLRRNRHGEQHVTLEPIVAILGFLVAALELPRAPGWA